MPQTLLLRLPPKRGEDTEWLTIEESGEPSTARQRGPLSLAAAVGRTAKVVVLAPAAQILLAEPDLPPGSGVKLTRAVPFALEEQLTEDIDQLVFTLGKRRTGGGTPVAVVSRSVLEAWITEVREAGLEPAAMYADMSLLPQNPGQTVLWLEGSRLAVRRPGQLPFAVELTPVTEALIVAGMIADPLASDTVSAESAAELAATVPHENAIFYVAREDWERVQDEIEGLVDEFASLKIQLLPDGALPWLARDLAATDAINLLQGEFAKTVDYGARWRKWRTPGILAASLLVLHVAAQAFTLHRAKQESAVLDTEIAQTFSAAMPADALQDPRRQMQTRLDHLRHSGPGPQVFLRTLQSLSGALAGTPDTTLDALTFHEEALDMRLTAPSLAALSQLSQSMGKQGLSAEIQSSTPAGSGIEAHMQVKTQGSKAHR